MTAGQIASALGAREVGINYLATDELIEHAYEVNPMDHLEWTKCHFDFKQMYDEHEDVSQDIYFPDGVTFKEPKES